MPLFRSEGIVLRTRDLGEHDRLVTLYTRDLGRLTAVARGARRVRSRFGGALELFTWGDAVGFERAGRDLLQLDAFDIRRSFRGLREDLARVGQGARIVEVVMRLTAERDSQPASFGLLLRALRALETGAAARVQLAFMLRFLDLAGHRPRLDRCGGCGRQVAGAPAAFDPLSGSVACTGCRTTWSVALSARTLGVLRGLQGAAWESRLRARIAEAVEREASGVLDNYVASLVGGPLRSPRFVAQTTGTSDPEAPHSSGPGR